MIGGPQSTFPGASKDLSSASADSGAAYCTAHLICEFAEGGLDDIRKVIGVLNLLFEPWQMERRKQVLKFDGVYANHSPTLASLSLVLLESGAELGYDREEP
ncbi:uncharacterized protein LOC130732784 [Lotus japonicus]|uniref:uncharacterized protein LOC130732784 n=1 Tax=Lotus japonicus TaxID=34305 RepID=UPI0025890ECA|nr:uncharacterized protein LOC130732784 [Lotus japonicus]